MELVGPREILELARERLPAAYQPTKGPAERSWEIHERESSWHALADGVELSAHQDALWATEAALSDLELWVAERARGRIFVHAGCAVHSARAILLPGYSMSGKSRLSAALVRAGAAYYSDEFAVLDSHGLVRPYARPPGLRSNLWEPPERTPLEELGGPVGRGPARVGLVAVLRYDSTSEWNVELLRRSKTILELMAHTVPAQYAPRRSLQALEQATKEAVAIKGVRGDADEAAARLLEILSAQAP